MACLRSQSPFVDLQQHETDSNTLTI